MANTSNIKTIKKRVEAIHPTIDSSLETIKNSLTPYNFLEVNENGFNKSNVLKDLANNFNKVPKSAPIGKIGNDVMGNEVQNAYPATPDMLKSGVSIVDVENPTQLITSNNNSNTIATDRADGNKDIKRWITRSIFKFREEDYGFDRQVYEIPVKLLMEGIVGVDGRHSTTLQEYPYPEEIVMISQKTDKNFIHFLNVQYSDSHYNYYRGKPYNLMIVKDRIDYGSVNVNGDRFNYYTSVYANNVEESLAFYKDGYLYLSMPDKSFGDELLNTLWDCKIIWRKDAPNREFTIQYDAEEIQSELESIPITNGQWKDTGIESMLKNNWESICYGNGKFITICKDYKTILYSTDGINWTSMGVSELDIDQHFTSINYCNDKFIITSGTRDDYGDSNIFVYSYDGLTWTQTTSGIPSNYWRKCVYGNGVYVSVTYNESNSPFIYSSDGINWTTATADVYGNDWYDVCFGNGRFVAVQDSHNYFAYSDNGITWVDTREGLHDNGAFKVTYGAGKYIAIGDGRAQYSVDGISWSELSSLSSSYTFFKGRICYGPSGFILYEDSERLLCSIDGLSWQSCSLQTPIPENTNSDVCYGNGIYVLMLANRYSKIPFKYCVVGNPGGISFDKSSYISEVSGKCHLLNKNILQSSSINSISKLEKDSNPLVTNNSISMGLSNNKGSLYRIPNYTTPYDLTFTDELSWSLTNFPNILIPINNQYYLGLNYITGIYSESTVLKDNLYYGFFNKILHKIDPTIKTTGDSNYPCDGMVPKLGGSGHIIKIIPIYSSITLANETGTSFDSIEVIVYTTRIKYNVLFHITNNGKSATATTTAISTFNGFEIADVKQISSTKAILITSTYNVYLDVIKEDSQTANPFGLSGAITPYLLSKYNIVGINTSKVVSSLADCSNTSKFASGINNGAIDVVINNSKLSGDGKYFINSGRYSIMKDNADTNYLVHLKEKYTFSSELDAPKSGMMWTETSNGLSRRDWRSICYGNGKYVAVSNSSTFAYSTDGITWTETSNGLDASMQCYHIIYTKDKFIMTMNNRKIAYSTDGVNWSIQNTGLEDDLSVICYGNNRYVATEQYIGNVFAYSTDGINWTDRIVAEGHWISICYGEDKFIVVAKESDTINVFDTFAYSTNGVNWNYQSNGLNKRYWWSICYGNGKYVATSDINIFAYSTDGITWTETSNGLNSRDWRSICYGNGKYVAVSFSNTFAYSTDGITWTETSNGLYNRDWWSICYGNGKYVAVANDSNTFAYSDGIIL